MKQAYEGDRLPDLDRRLLDAFQKDFPLSPRPFAELAAALGVAEEWVIERLRLNTGAYPFPQVGHITVSVGFSELKAGDSPSSAIERADKAVYYAKGHGRNQVQSHADLVARGELELSEKVGDVELF